MRGSSDPEISEQVLSNAALLWNYHQLHHILTPKDCILVMGSIDLRIADRAAALYLDGMAPLVIFSGGFGNFTRGVFEKPEAQLLKERALSCGMPEKVILVEDKSTNTGENVSFSRKLLIECGHAPRSFLLVHKPNMERRAFATFQKLCPEQTEVLVTSPRIPFLKYPNDAVPLAMLIHVMVGDLQRIMEYPRLGFQSFQAVPDEVEEAFHALIGAGFTQHLMMPCQLRA